MSKKFVVVNGPNLNLLGEREPGIYGSMNYQTLIEGLQQWGTEHQVEVVCFQSNHEGEIVDFLQANRGSCDGFVLNLGAFTHYSYAISDCIRAIHRPFIEVHISNVHKREAFRHHSVISDVCVGSIVGLGTHGYFLALEHLLQLTAE